MRRALPLFFLAVSAALFGQSYTVVDSVRLPAQSFVGDAVELRYQIRTDATLSIPDQLPQPAWGTLERVELDESSEGWVVRIVVVPFEPGTLTLPRLTLGEIDVDGFSLVVSSVLGEEPALEPIYGPQRLPGTRGALILAAVLIAAAATSGLYVLGPGRRQLQALIARYRARLPYRRLRKELALLEAEGDQLPAREFYIGLIESVQRYMSSVLRVDCRAATTSELVRYLPALASLSTVDRASVSPLEPLLHRADNAKFAGLSVAAPLRHDDLALCTAVFEAVEEGRRRMRARPAASEVTRARL